jgi:hypothetical protein
VTHGRGRNQEPLDPPAPIREGSKEELAARVSDHEGKGSLDKLLNRGLTVATITEKLSRLLLG